MATAKQIGVVGAFVVALILGAPGTASASFSVSGRLVNVGDEPRAAGSWTATWHSEWRGPVNSGFAVYVLELDVSCTKLTPGATYVVYAATTVGDASHSFVAQKGAKSGEVLLGFMSYVDYPSLLSIEVYRVDGSNLVPVLAASFR